MRSTENPVVALAEAASIPSAIVAQFEKDWATARGKRPKISKGDAFFGYVLALKLMWLKGRSRRPPPEPDS